MLVRSADGRITVDEHTRAEPPHAGAESAGAASSDTESNDPEPADVVVVVHDGVPSWGRLLDHDRELASAHPGALVTLIACGPDLALVRLGSPAPGSARRTNTARVWSVYASILHALTVWEVAPH